MATEDWNKINFYCDKLWSPRSEYFMKPFSSKSQGEVERRRRARVIIIYESEGTASPCFFGPLLNYHHLTSFTTNARPAPPQRATLVFVGRKVINLHQTPININPKQLVDIYNSRILSTLFFLAA